MISATSSRIRIATRESRLAMWQAEHVAARLREACPEVEVELLPMTTTGDQRLDVPLAKVGGKGLFLKELERAMQEGRADIAVHSMKDVPAELPPGLCIAAILERADPHDAFVSNDFADLSALPHGARLGTSSLRRQCQVKALRPDLGIVPLRGNVETRLRKLDEGECDAALLATAGLVRLGLADRVRHSLDPRVCLPAIGQGAIGIECRSDDAASIALARRLGHPATDARVRAERALNEGLEGSCHAPIAGFAVLSETGLELRGLVGHPDGSPLLRAERTGPADHPRELGLALAEELLALGAGRILAALGHADT